MKIGVALSGCDICGVGAHAALRELERQGLRISMISACGVPAVTALPFARGRGQEECLALAKAFLTDWKRVGPQAAAARRTAAGQPKIPLAVSAVQITDGTVVLFTDSENRFGGGIRVLPLGNARDALMAVIPPAGGLDGYEYGGLKLCDFSVWHGCPIHPLRLAGMERTISVAFPPRRPGTPCEVMVKRKIVESGSLADVHISVEPEEGAGAERCAELAAGQVKACAEEILARTL